MYATQAARARRWNSVNHHFGPFTYSRDGNSDRKFGVVLDSGHTGDGDRKPRCCLRVHFFGHTFFAELPPLLKPYREYTDLRHYEWAKTPGYWETFPREFGFVAYRDDIHYYYGPQTHDSVTTKSGVAYIPWMSKRFSRHSIYGLKGEELWTQQGDAKDFNAYWWAKEAAPKARFEIEDGDGTRVKVTTLIEEREWRHGIRAFKWLSLFVAPKVVRSLDIDFDKEVGPEKGSWKGGLMGTSIDMLPGELHEQAFKRYCDQEHRAKHGRFRVTFIGPVS